MSQQLTEITPISPAELKKFKKLFEPLNDVIIVALDTSDKITSGGIILPEAATANMTAQSGTVIARGPGARSPLTGERITLSLEVGDRIIFGQYAGHDIKYGDVTLKAMREPDCMTKVSDDDALQPESVQISRKKASKKTKGQTKGKKAKAKAGVHIVIE